eukprot:GFUD01010939.1.p1 GENE.GFUD01010939.1~~GFUD01010939.1.p1  ORF type:complete len:473 (+),score=127.09 GFUD01010939.1:237-1655(+)
MDRFVFQIKQSALHPISSLLKDKGYLIAGAAGVLILSTFFSVLVSWSLTFHSLNNTFISQQGANIDQHKNITEALALAIKKIKETQNQVLGKLKIVEQRMENLVSKTYVDVQFNDAKELSASMNATVYETKRTSDGLFDNIKKMNEKINETNTNLSHALVKIKEGNDSQTTKIDKLESSIESLKATNLETIAFAMEKNTNDMKNIKSNLSNTNSNIDDIRTSFSKNTNSIGDLQSSLKDVMENTERLTNISEKLAIASTLIANTTGSPIPDETVSSIQNGLVTEVTAQLKVAMKHLEDGIDGKVQQITEAASKETAIVKDDLKKFKSKYQNDRFKNLGYIEIGENGQYLVSSSSRSWVSAQRDCNTKMGYLVEFTTQEEQDQVVNYLQSNDHDLEVFWLGGRDESTEGHFTWQHSHNKIEEGYTCWREGEPNDYGHGEDCVEFTDGKWNDVSCDEDRHYICKFDDQNLVFEF